MNSNVLSRFLTDEATDEIINHVGDYSDTGTGPYFASYGPPIDRILVIRTINIVVEDSGTLTFDEYGSDLILTNGITIGIKNDQGIIRNITGQLPIKKNGDWLRYSDTQVIESSFGAANNYAIITYKLDYPIILDGNDNESFYIRLHDNFTGLVSQTFYIAGIELEHNSVNRRMLNDDYYYLAKPGQT